MDSARLRLYQLGSEAETFPSLNLTVFQFSLKRKVRGSTPSSPVRQEPHPLHWFVRDIDIGDTPPSDTRSDTGAMTRSVSSVTSR